MEDFTQEEVDAKAQELISRCEGAIIKNDGLADVARATAEIGVKAVMGAVHKDLRELKFWTAVRTKIISHKNPA